MKAGRSLFNALQLAVLEAAKFNKSVQEAPTAILWTDAERQWASVVSRLRAVGIPILSLGEYDPPLLQGPAIWLKCALARALGEVVLGEGIPVVYLPGVSRANLRAIESCPRHLQPIAELQYRGVFWTQVNAKDWTINAFLTSKKGGLGLDVGHDNATQEALLRALDALMDISVDQLSGKQLKAADFDRLLVADPVRDVLTWMNSPAVTRASWGEGRWAAFVGRCQQDFGLNPEKDGEFTAAERLAARQEEAWVQVWERYAEAPDRYTRVLELLRSVPPPQDMFANTGGYPKVNDDAEVSLCAELVSTALLPRPEARRLLDGLEKGHAGRRQQLWSRMGLAPLAQALEHLARLGSLASTPLRGSVAEMAACYRDQLWCIDDAAVSALGCVHAKPDQSAVDAVLRTLYVPWMADCAVCLQEQAKQEGGLGGSPTLKEPEPPAYMAGLCMVFVDGLRYDIAHRLVDQLQAAGHQVELDTAWTSVPSVTASGKAWVSPVAHRIAGGAADSDFEPGVKGEGKTLNTHHFRRLLTEESWQFLTPSECGEVSGKAWTEAGDLDNYGHQNGLKLARDMDRLLRPIAERIQELVEAGWPRIRVVTDHGWLLVPGGMPKVDLPKYMANTRWGRCAVLKEHARTDFLTLGWGWAPEVPIAMAPGISSFIAGMEYAHGGLSFQESLVPIINLKAASAKSKVALEVKTIQWSGLRCRIEVVSEGAGLWADIRAKAADASSSLVNETKPVRDGGASLMVLNDEAEGRVAFVVIYDESGKLLAKKHTVIGE